MTADYFENILFRYWLISKFEPLLLKVGLAFELAYTQKQHRIVIRMK